MLQSAALRRRVVRGAITITATVRAATGARNESLVPAASPAAIPAMASGAAGNPPAGDARGSGVAVDQDRHRSEDEGDAGDVVERLAGLELDQALRAERHRGADQRLRAEPIRPADAPGSEQRHRQQAQVEHGRDAVAVEEQDPERVQDLGVGRVEGGEEDRVEELDLAQIAGLHEPRGERHVVPEAVGAVHAGGQRPQGRHHPGGGEPGAREHGDRPGRSPGSGRRRRLGRPHGPVGRQPGGDQAGRHPGSRQGAEHSALLEAPKVPSASQTQIRPATASTVSASRAGAPDQPGSSKARTR